MLQTADLVRQHLPFLSPNQEFTVDPYMDRLILTMKSHREESLQLFMLIRAALAWAGYGLGVGAEGGGAESGGEGAAKVELVALSPVFGEKWQRKEGFAWVAIPVDPHGPIADASAKPEESVRLVRYS